MVLKRRLNDGAFIFLLKQKANSAQRSTAKRCDAGAIFQIIA